MKKIIILVVLILSFFLAGCWDKLELEERAFVVVIGIDKGKDKNMSVTFQIANPQVGTTDVAKAENEPASTIITLEVPDISASTELANITISRNLTFTHVGVIIIGEGFAKSDQFLSLLEYLMRDRELNREVDMIICKEKAADFIRNNNPELETRPHKHYELMSRRWENIGLIPYTTFQRYIGRMLGDMGIYLAAHGTTIKEEPNPEGKEDNYIAGQVDKYGGNIMQMIGSAVLKEGKMIGKMTGEETRATLLLRPKIRSHSFLVVYEDPINKEYNITARFIKYKKNKYKMELFEKTPKIHVTVPADIEILGIPSGIDYVTNFRNQKILEESIEEQLNKKIAKLVKRTQKEFKGSPFQWAGLAARQFSTAQKFKEYDWMKTYPEMDITVDFEIEIVDFGRQLQPYDQKKIKD